MNHLFRTKPAPCLLNSRRLSQLGIMPVCYSLLEEVIFLAFSSSCSSSLELLLCACSSFFPFSERISEVFCCIIKTCRFSAGQSNTPVLPALRGEAGGSEVKGQPLLCKGFESQTGPCENPAPTLKGPYNFLEGFIVIFVFLGFRDRVLLCSLP